MGWVRRVVVWMAWCAAVTASINFLLITRAPSPPSLHHHHRTPTPSTTLFYDHHLLQKVYMQGEVYALRDSEYHKFNRRNRSGLSMLRSLYAHLPAVRAQYTSVSQELKDIVEILKRDITRRRLTDDPWDLARKWANPRSLVPEPARGLGDVLAALATAPIVATDVGYRGTQLKVSMILKGGQRVVFKPRWYTREELIEGEVYAGADRHNGEIAAFHLGRLLGLTMVPLAVGRTVSLKRQILPVATRTLASTFFRRRGGKTCFFGVCYYCHKDSSVCDSGGMLEGTVIMWLPRRLNLMHLPHPWARTYKRGKTAPWEDDPNYCSSVLRNPYFSEDKFARLLDLMDTAVFDFLIQNGDRHHYTLISGRPDDSSMVLLDNGKSFGDAYVDHMDVLAPLIQCCRLRQTTYDRLILLTGGGLSEALGELLSQDPVAPVLTKPHLRALDRRVLHILASLSMCREQRGGWHNVLY